LFFGDRSRNAVLDRSHRSLRMFVQCQCAN